MLVLMFLLGVYAKTRVTEFFSLVTEYQSKIQVLEPELANQSLSALLQMELIVGQFTKEVYFTYILMIFVVPFFIYFLLSLSQALNVKILKGKIYWKYWLITFSLGIPILIIFYLIENNFVKGFAYFLDSYVGLAWFLGTLLFLVLAGYVWYTWIISLAFKSTINWQIFYKKIHKVIWWYLAMVLCLLIIFLILGTVLISYLTEAFVGYGWIGTLAISLVLIALIQYLRYRFISAVIKHS